MSPATLLTQRKGNSFEIATLLCSLLIGTGFAAMVVSGYATREVSLNDQRRVDCPLKPDSIEEIQPEEYIVPNKHALRDPPDLQSKFLVQVEKREIAKELAKQKIIDDEIKAKREASEKVEYDPYHGLRLHAWVAIIENAPWCYKPRIENDKSLNEYSVFFIEPSTGFRFEADNPNYLGIESVWNQHNYYINRQEPIIDIKSMKWDFQNTENWEHLLPGEPTELRIRPELPDDQEALSREEELLEEKHLDMPPSWVQQLHIGSPEFQERYPNGEKMVHYKRAIVEKFAPYKKTNGLMQRLTTYETLDYEDPKMRWEWYANRKDLLQMIKIDFTTKQLEECFAKGRPDCLKYYTYNADETKEKLLKFYHIPRLDSLSSLEIQPSYIREHFNSRKDLLYFREYKLKEKLAQDINERKSLLEISEKFYRNSSKAFNKDIALRKFNMNENIIYLQFHYAADAITANTRIFVKPPKPDYGCQIEFIPENSTGYIANAVEIEPTQLEQYTLLLEQLEAEENCKTEYDLRCDDIDKILQLRKSQILNPKLVYSIFDPLRNEAARKIRMTKYDMLKEQNDLAMKTEADFLAPFLVGFTTPNKEQSMKIFQDCLNDIKRNFLDMLNELQRRYDEHVSEAQHFKMFLNRFQDQFDDFEYDQLIKEGENIEINKRMIQQRLINTQETAQKKYEKIKNSLLKDSRLDLPSNFMV